MKDFLREPLKRSTTALQENKSLAFRKRQTFHWKKGICNDWQRRRSMANRPNLPSLIAAGPTAVVAASD
jgi:hypothetical protein